MKIRVLRLVAATVALFMAAVNFSVSAAAPASDMQNEDAAQPESTWVVPIVMDDPTAAPSIVPGEWIDAEDLASSGKADSDYAGFILKYANAVLTIHRSTLDGFVKDAKKIMIDFEDADQATYQALPFDKILCVMVFEGYVRITTRPDWVRENITTRTLSDIEALGNGRAMMKAAQAQ